MAVIYQILNKISGNLKRSEAFQKAVKEGRIVNIQKHREAMAKAKGIPIAQYDLSGNLVNTYNSISEAARALKVNKNTIYNVLNNDKRLGKGFRWKTIPI